MSGEQPRASCSSHPEAHDQLAQRFLEVLRLLSRKLKEFSARISDAFQLGRSVMNAAITTINCRITRFSGQLCKADELDL